MNILISNSSGFPIYEQITKQIKDSIMREVLKEGEVLPSIRSLAKSLGISVITVQRAYDDLQRDGFVESVKGKGTFVAGQNKEFIKEEKQKEIETHLFKAIDIAKTFGISYENLIKTIEIIYQEG